MVSESARDSGGGGDGVGVAVGSLVIAWLWPMLARIEHRKARSSVETWCWRKGSLKLFPLKIGTTEHDCQGLLEV